jgi:DNA-binding response OmpR family regulator
MPKRILVVDDEARLVSLVRGYLEQEQYEVASAGNGRDGFVLTRQFNPDLIILDLMMPEMDGWEFLRLLRRERDTPVIMLTARVEETDRIAGLEMGADDYLTKPFSPRELMARVRAVLRRTQPSESGQPEILRAGDLELDLSGHMVREGGRHLDLTPMEFDLLAVLMRNPGRVFSRLELLEQTQGYAFDGYERTIDVHIKNLRKKLEQDSSQPRYVLTVFGVGYRLNPDA